MVVLVVLVLTVIGIGVTYFTTVEDRLAGNNAMQKTGFYAAETGLRVGEKLISDALGDASAPITFQDLLARGPATYSFPGSTYKALKLEVPDGTAVTGSTIAGDATKGTYTLYIRNNIEDLAGPTTDSDNQITLISVGQITSTTGTLGGGSRILEEAIKMKSVDPTDAGEQVGGGAGGSNTIAN